MLTVYRIDKHFSSASSPVFFFHLPLSRVCLSWVDRGAFGSELIYLRRRQITDRSKREILNGFIPFRGLGSAKSKRSSNCVVYLPGWTFAH